MSQYKKDIYSKLSTYSLKTLGKFVIPPTPPCSPVYVTPIAPVFLLPETIKTIDVPYDNKLNVILEEPKLNIEQKQTIEPKIEKQRTSFDLCRIF